LPLVNQYIIIVANIGIHLSETQSSEVAAIGQHCRGAALREIKNES